MYIFIHMYLYSHISIFIYFYICIYISVFIYLYLYLYTTLLLGESGGSWPGESFGAHYVTPPPLKQNLVRELPSIISTAPRFAALPRKESLRSLKVYGLSQAQELKNKDIPEGGAKAVVLIDTTQAQSSHNRYLTMRTFPAERMHKKNKNKYIVNRYII